MGGFIGLLLLIALLASGLHKSDVRVEADPEYLRAAEQQPAPRSGPVACPGAERLCKDLTQPFDAAAPGRCAPQGSDGAR